MSLTVGAMVGPYEIVSLLGAGGMGEVYRARDTRLERTVAIKVLPSALALNVGLRERFEREARAISALSHPNICALYDIGRDGATEYLVLEYLEGETLADRIARGPIPASQLLRFGSQIAEALQSAHRAGITHRDLKPGNIMITNGGAKLLDFGLARFIEPERNVVPDSTAPTRVGPLTAEGTIVGTFQYMSPEQIEARPLDHRTDIFSLGVILYEMATGRRPFRGDSPVSVIAAVLSTDPPPIRSLQPSASAALERIVLTALEKNPDERWQTAQDIGRQLRWISESSHTAEQPAPSPRRRLPLSGVIALVAIAASLLTWGAVRFFARSASKGEALRLQFAPPAEFQFRYSPEATDFALSQDGRAIAFVATVGGAQSLFLRRFDSFDVIRIAGSEDAFGPFWSSDGQWIGFNAHGKLWKTKTAGDAPPIMLCEIQGQGARASWQGGTILFDEARGRHREIYRIPDNGGNPVHVTNLQSKEWRHSWPQLFPDGKHFLYLSAAVQSLERSLILASLDSKEQTVLLRNVSQVRLRGNDQLVYVRDATLLSQRFHFPTGTVAGDPVTIAADVDYFYPSARAAFDASATGVLVYRTNTTTGRLVQMDRKGVETRVVGEGLFYDHALAPNGKSVAVSVETRATGLMDIWIYDLARGVRDRFTSEPAIEVSPTWAPDGRSIVYAQSEGGAFPHLVRRALGSTTSENLFSEGSFQFNPAFSPDGKTVFYENESGNGIDIYRVDTETRRSEPVSSSTFNERDPMVSPDGKWLAFVSNATGTNEIYIQSLNATSERIRISAKGGLLPRWRHDSRELDYISPEQAVISVVPGPTGNWDGATATELFRYPVRIQGFAVLPDSQSFLISDRRPGAGDSLFHVVLGAE